MTTYECDSAAEFDDDTDLPEGECDENIAQFSVCMSNMANGWAVGGDHVRPIEFVLHPFDFPFAFSDGRISATGGLSDRW